MSKSKHVIRGEFFPPHFRVLGFIFLAVSLFFFESQYRSYSPVPFLLGFILMFSHFGLVVDSNKRTIKKYFSIFFIRIGRKKTYELLTCFWLTSHRMKDVWQNQAVSTETRDYGVVNVYLVTSDGDNYYVFQKRSKQSVYENLADVMLALNISCLDKHPNVTK